MIGRFKDSFGKKKDESRELPTEVLDILNAALPDNFMYVMDDSGHYKAVPRPEKLSQGVLIKITSVFDEEKDADILAKLKRIPREKWGEYLYRTQIRIPVRETKIGNDKKTIPIEELSNDPLSEDKVEITKQFFQSGGFADPISLKFESPEGETVEIGIQQQAYDNLLETKHNSIGFPALKIELYRYSPLVEECEDDAHTSASNPLVIRYSVSPNKAESVEDAVVALHLFRGFYNGTSKVNGQVLSPPGEQKSFDSKRMEQEVLFWEDAKKLEEKLKVRFNPGANSTEEDARLFAYLRTSILEKRTIVWRHPFDHFRINQLDDTFDKAQYEEIIGKGPVKITSLDGPISAKLLGADLVFYIRTEMIDLIVTNIEFDSEKKEAEIYISDVPNKQWTLNQLYLTEEEAKEYMEKQNNVEIKYQDT